MRMNNKLAFSFWMAALALFVAGLTRAEDQLDPETKARIEKYEQGAATIDVSKYPQGIQDNYEVFAQKCAQCHKLSRPINCDYVLPDDWSRYVKRMMHKPGSGIDSADGKKIYEFLVYDSSVRKKAMLDDKLAKVTADDKAGCRGQDQGSSRQVQQQIIRFAIGIRYHAGGTIPMSDELKSDISRPSEARPSASRSTAPIWIIVLTLLLLFLGAVYFDRHGGWFDKQVYAPYTSADELASYQPKSGEASILSHGKAVYETYCGLCHGSDGLGKPGQAPELAGSEWVSQRHHVAGAHSAGRSQRPDSGQRP